MAWELILWFIFFIINIALLALNLYQIICLSDLESDYLNPYELASRINAVILPEFILQGVFSILFLLKGHWFMFLLTVPITYYHTMLYMKRKHLIDVTEVFSVLSSQKKSRIIKLGFYLFFFTIVIVRIFAAGLLYLFSTLWLMNPMLCIYFDHPVLRQYAIHCKSALRVSDPCTPSKEKGKFNVQR